MNVKNEFWDEIEKKRDPDILSKEALEKESENIIERYGSKNSPDVPVNDDEN